MILSVHWPHNGAKSARFGDLPCPIMGLLSRYLPERSDGLELQRSMGPDPRAWDHGGRFEPIRLPDRSASRVETVSEPTGNPAITQWVLSAADADALRTQWGRMLGACREHLVALASNALAPPPSAAGVAHLLRGCIHGCR